MRLRILKGWALFALAAACGCSEVLGAEGLEYNLTADGGVASEPNGPGMFADCAGTAGPTPINVEGKFCIDSTEVTNAQYKEFIDAAEEITQPEACSWNAELGSLRAFEPLDHWPPPEPLLEHPVDYVDWCDAWAYCHWAGKRLCARVDGTPPDFEDYASTRSELFYACSQGGELAYPYGDTYSPQACATEDRSQTLPVGSLPDCQGGYSGVFDLSGNSAEWNGLCNDAAGATDYCRIGPDGVTTYELPFDHWSCGFSASQPRNTASSALGIRCCSDPL
jgi:formylglycine-generating enzyme